MKSNIEIYLDHLDDLAGKKGKFHKISDDDVHPGLWVVTYNDVPDSGSSTSFTFGLSEVDHPEWKLGRPELAISVHSHDDAWGLAAGFVAYQLRGKCAFCYGDYIRFNAQISNESQMDAFFVFTPMIMDKEQYTIRLSEREIHIVQLYPIYSSEIALIEGHGATVFWRSEGIDFFDIKREPRTEL
jgi:Suppressor of fused protein (SUFU)